MKKVTFYTDEDLWKRFSASILEKEGSTRKISEKLQNLMKEFLKLLKTMKVINKNSFNVETDETLILETTHL